MKRSGLTLVEILIAGTIMVTVLVGMALFQTATLKVNSSERDRAFAVQKAVQIMEEILAFQITSGTKGTDNIDTLAQADSEFSFKLTIDPKVSDPKMALSGNKVERSGYRFVRQIRVEPVSNEKGARRVTVALYIGDGASTAGPLDNTKPLSLVTNIVKAQTITSQPTQVYDLYLVDIENTIGWWSDPNTLRPTLASTIDFLKSNNPGLDIRTHWVRRLAYGRDTYYKPISNKQYPLTDTANVPLDWVYFYPGKRTATATRYNPDVLRGQLRVDGSTMYGVDPDTWYEKQGAYAYADQFNHAVRYPEEVEKYDQDPNPAKEMSLRMLLEKMAAGELHNAIIVNLHAELIPMPPMRNYSDAARVPRYMDNKDHIKDHFGAEPNDNAEIDSGSRARLVTHPRQLWVKPHDDYESDDGKAADHNTVHLYVYPHLSRDHATEPPSKYREVQVVLRELKDVINDSHESGNWEKDIEIDVMNREVNSGGQGAYYWRRIWPDSNDNSDNSMNRVDYSSSAKSTFLDDVKGYNSSDTGKGIRSGDLVVKLKNVPYTHLPVSQGSNKFGLPLSQTLHGFNYFPDPANYFLDDNWPGAEVPRNTARFRISFKTRVAKRLEVLTTIGKEDDLDKHQAPNRSRTWVWVADNADNIPLTEQYQYVGDPRCNPDALLRAGGGYSRYFANFSADAYQNGGTQAWDAFPAAIGSWDGQEGDMPRYFELWRKALLKANGLYLNPAGFSFYYVGMGGEIYEPGLSLSAKPFGSAGTTTFDDIIGVTRLPVKADGSWYAKPWMGELYPDDQWNNWMSLGNLPSSAFHLRAKSAAPSWMPAGGNPDHVKRLGPKGSAAFFNGGTGDDGATTFMHVGTEGLGQLTSSGQSVANSFKMYLDSEYPSNRSFLFDATSGQPPDWSSTETAGLRTKLEWGLHNGTAGYYKHNASATAQSVAPIVMRRDSGAGYVVMAGLAPSVDSGTTSIARLALASSLQAFFDLASPTYADMVTQKKHEAIKLVPRVNLYEPVEDTQLDGNSVKLKWTEAWARWNLEPYTTAFSDYGSSAYKPNRVYNIKYSTDGGTSWKFINGGGTAKAGVYEATRAIYGTDYTWSYNNWANREYLVRLECYRNHDGFRDTHYAFHQVTYTIAH